MTEGEWLECADPEPMLEFLKGRITARKARLFACACCRRIPRLTGQPRIRRSIEVAERYADGEASDQMLGDAFRILLGPYLSEFDGVEAVGAATMRPVDAPLAARIAANVAALADAPPHWAIPTPESLVAEQGRLAATLRDLVGDSFRHQGIDGAWLLWEGGTITTLAGAAYSERILPSGELDNARLAVLSDALEEAGCDSADILNH